MKKSYLNIAINVALTGIVLSSLILQTQVNASTTDNVSDSANSEVNISGHSNSKHSGASNNGTSNNETTNSEPGGAENYLYPGMGVGAATGTLIAGPVGFVIGGAIGALIGVNQDVDTEKTGNSDSQIASGNSQQGVADNDIASDNIALQATTEDSLSAGPVLVAQVGSLNSAIISDDPQDELMNILVSDLSLDVYFRSGSTDIEKFYPARLTAIANLVNSMDKLELHLDGYTDRRGNKDQNIALANTRIERVREQLIDAGVNPERIVSKAFGEAKMKSAAGNLEAYTFDRRVVIRFERITTVNSAMDTALIDIESTGDMTTGNEPVIDEIVADESSSDLALTETSGIDQSNTEITDPEPVGLVTIDFTIDSETAQAPSLEETNPTVADATNQF